MVNSLRFWLVSSFGVILLISLVAIWLFINAINKSKRLEDYHSHLKSTRILLLETYKLKEDVIFGDSNETEFYTNSFSALEKELQELNVKTTYHINYLLLSNVSSHYKLLSQIKGLKIKLTGYIENYNELIYLFKLKGFKNYGLEGKMRQYAHNIFNINDRDIQYFYLVLRKHEKDFLLRKDPEYITQFNATAGQLLNCAENKTAFSKKQKDYIISNLYYYIKYFRILSRIERKIGVKGKDGSLNRSKIIFDDIDLRIEALDNALKKIEEQQKEKLKRDTVVVIIILILFLASTIIILTRLITESVKSISATFNNYVNSGFNFDSVSYKRSIVSEFNSIYVSFIKMAKEIHIFTNFFREKVHERTLEIVQQKDEILTQQAKIEKQYKSLLIKNDQLKCQKQLLALKNSDIRDSLRYAKRIQKAIQPKMATFKECFNDSFIFSKAKDVVSGDFYLVYKMNESQLNSSERIVFVASDCTGHGVPGAIMSVLGINTINKLVRERKNSDPGRILRLLDRDINQVLSVGKQKSDIVADGMDISVFSFNPQSYLLEYSIAKFSHYLIRNSTIINLTTQKSSIGHSSFENDVKNFLTHSFQLQQGDCLYLFSDGFIDQFGGPFNKKYKKSNIRRFIENIHEKSMNEQKELFKQEFKTWKGSLDQIDDVTVIGIRF